MISDSSRERLDLVADDAAHGLGAFARFLGQFQDAALDFLAGHVEVALQVLRRLAHLAGGFGEALGWLR